MRYSVKCRLRYGVNVVDVDIECVEFIPTVGIPDYYYHNLEQYGIQLVYSPVYGDLWATQGYKVVGNLLVESCQN